jgi:catechol 2,3-dioxygenase-like lactoylglutathione lyase family enzyme
MTTDVLRLHHIAIVVRDIAQTAAWYRDHLGFQHQYDFALPGAQLSMIVRGDARLELIAAEGAAPAAPERREVDTILKVEGVNHFALPVGDVDAVVAELTEKGVAVVIPPTDVPNGSGDRFAFVRDNERNLIELLQPAA